MWIKSMLSLSPKYLPNRCFSSWQNVTITSCLLGWVWFWLVSEANSTCFLPTAVCRCVSAATGSILSGTHFNGTHLHILGRHLGTIFLTLFCFLVLSWSLRVVLDTLLKHSQMWFSTEPPEKSSEKKSAWYTSCFLVDLFFDLFLLNAKAFTAFLPIRLRTTKTARKDCI